MNKFKEIFEKYDTDKAVNYSEAYENCFSKLRNDIKLIFEIGVNRGGSVRGWKEYFPNAIIVGIEIDRKFWFKDDRIKIHIGDATDNLFINFLIKEYGIPDIVIDDGSHFSSDIKKSFKLLYDKAKTCYAIEDYGTQFKEFKGGFYINDGEPATKIAHDLVDSLLFDKKTCSSIHFFHSICLIFK